MPSTSWKAPSKFSIPQCNEGGTEERLSGTDIRRGDGEFGRPNPVHSHSRSNRVGKNFTIQNHTPSGRSTPFSRGLPLKGNPYDFGW